jgi:hypothetical protein
MVRLIYPNRIRSSAVYMETSRLDVLKVSDPGIH